MMKLYGFATFDRSAKARWLLTELGVAFDDYHLDNEAKEHESPAFLKLNPMGRIPVLEHDLGVTFESGAICMYLADRFAERGLAPPPSSPTRPAYLQWMFFASATLDTLQTRIMVIEDIPAGEVRSQKETALLSDLSDAVSAIDLAVSRDSYLVGNRFSAADICVGYHLFFLTLWPELNAVIRKFPRATAYLDRLKQMPGAVKSEALSYEG
jgi:glutathione S-transferase